MEKLALASAKPVLGLGYQWTATRSLQPLPLRRHSTFPNSRANVRAAAASSSTRRVSIDGKEKLRAEIFASVSSTSGAGRETSSVGDNPNLAVPPSSSNFGSPLFWIGVGVGLSALFSWLASYLKRYAMQQAMKTMMGQMAPQNSQFGASNFSTGSPFSYPPPSPTGSATSPGLPFPFPPPPATGPFASPVTATPTTSASATVDVSATNIEATPTTNVKTDEEVKPEPKRIAFEDVSPEEALPKSPFEKYEDSSTTTSKDVKFAEVITGNGAATAESIGESASNDSQSTRNSGPIMSVEALEKMMEDPTVQQMVYPYLPEEMRNPATFKWMLQNPEYRKQLQDMLTNMGGSAGWDNRMMDTMKNFDLSSPEVKQQFDQIGLTPEEVISKIMANPDVAMAFQNPRVQAAIMDCSQNPFNITKYQNDKEVVASVEKKAPLKVMISGAPASGKGTQCELITKKYGLVHIAAGDLLRAEIASGSENGKLAKEYMEKGQLVPDEIVVMMVKDRLSQPDSTHKGWLLDGYPRSSSQANALKEFGFQPDLFILLEVSEDLLVERVVGRRLDPVTGKIYHLKYSPPENEEIGARLTQRFDDTEEKVKLRLTTHHQNVEAVLSMYEDITIKVDGNASKDDVFAQIDSTLGNLLEQKLAAGKAVAQ